MTNIILKLPATLDRTGLTRSALYVLIAEGKFPKSIKLNKRSCCWIEHEVQEWIDERIAERDEGLEAFSKITV
ncbi:MAG: AlpA family phage regulatory protein [Methylococcaceae bacterium]